ncbi:MAG: N-acetylgalactosamine 6-sulfate sulfatase [Planctomycetaceae bacterium]|nr:N-acetylgalactosamine 6-sulfate sulfatase [Planctomycetaceae bacterium]
MRKLALLLIALLTTELVQAKQPNVVVILTDDQGWGDLSLHGNKNISTPNLDALAKSGARFDRFYVCAVCSPTRAEFLTGRYHPRGGVFSTSAGGERLDLDEVTIADTFKAAGYVTGAFGKWHNGMQYPYHPNGRGFDEYYGFTSGHWGHYFSPVLEHNGALTRGKGFCVDDFTNRAIDFIEESVKQDKPFFAYLPYNTPHSPMQVPDRFWKKFDGVDLVMRNRDPQKENLQHSRAALAMCENVDWNVGRLVKSLQKMGIADNTIVVFFHDNGPNGSRWNDGMRGRKGSTDEGGCRSPLFISWPGKVRQNTFVTQIASVTDLLPTLSNMAGINLIGDKPLDGIDLSSWISNPQKAHNERIIINAWKGKISARNQQYRLDNVGRLYDITNDPHQEKDIVAQQPEIAEMLGQAVADFKSGALQDYKTSNEGRPFVICHKDYKWTQVPARDGIADGNIIRSNKFPNCSYFLNWISTDDKITWPAEVQHSGRYRVYLHYTCKKENVGCRVQLRFNGATISTKIGKAHNPPEIGAGEDRFKRVESYVKFFKEIELGDMQLDAGAGDLTLTVPEMPGNEGIEFRLLMFERIDQ